MTLIVINDTCVSCTSQNRTPRHGNGGRQGAYEAEAGCCLNNHYSNIKITKVINMATYSAQEVYRTIFVEYPDVVSVNQMSKMLNVSAKTAYKMLRNNTITNFKVGRKYLIPKVYILQYLEIVRGA